jgi:hypothetical protein
VLSADTTSLDLSGAATSGTVTVTASGSGWAAWHVDTAGTDLTFTPDHGVLAAGGQATIVVGLASSQDGQVAQSFTVAGVTVTVALPVPAPLPSPADTTTPGDTPSPAPS